MGFSITAGSNENKWGRAQTSPRCACGNPLSCSYCCEVHGYICASHRDKHMDHKLATYSFNGSLGERLRDARFSEASAVPVVPAHISGVFEVSVLRTNHSVPIEEGKARKIMELYNKGIVNKKRIALMVGCSHTTVTNVFMRNGITTESKGKWIEVSNTKKEEILALSRKGLSQAEVAEKLAINQSSVSRALNREKRA